MTKPSFKLIGCWYKSADNRLDVTMEVNGVTMEFQGVEELYAQDIIERLTAAGEAEFRRRFLSGAAPSLGKLDAHDAAGVLAAGAEAEPATVETTGGPSGEEPSASTRPGLTHGGMDNLMRQVGAAVAKDQHAKP